MNRNSTTHIVGLSERENDVLLPFLFDHVRSPEFQCRFHWEVGSIAFWDNRSVQHYAVADYDERRIMHRATIDGPIACRRLDGDAAEAWPDGRDAAAESTNVMDYEAQVPIGAGRGRTVHPADAVGLLVDAFQHRCLDPFGLLFIDYSVLRVLELIGPPHRMSPTELSEILVRSSGGITQILDRLERAGLVALACPIPTTGARLSWSSRPTACAPPTRRTRPTCARARAPVA